MREADERMFVTIVQDIMHAEHSMWSKKTKTEKQQQMLQQKICSGKCPVNK